MIWEIIVMKTKSRKSLLLLALILASLLLFSCSSTGFWTPFYQYEKNRLTYDTSVDFSPLFDGNPEIKAWRYVTKEMDTVTNKNSVVTYIVEVDKASANQFFSSAVGTLDTNALIIKHFTYNRTSKNKAYLEISQYPEGYNHMWSIVCYWHDGKAWNYSREIQADEGFKLILYRDMTSSRIENFFPEAKKIGSNITTIYQCYRGNDPALVSDHYHEYLVEYNSISTNLRSIVSSMNNYTKGELPTNQIIPRDDTLAFIILREDVNGKEPLSACILTKSDDGKGYYTTYTFLPLTIEGDKLKIGDKYLD